MAMGTTHSQYQKFKLKFFVSMMGFFFTTLFGNSNSQTLDFPHFDSLPSEQGWSFTGDDINIFSLENGLLIQNSMGTGQVRGHFDIQLGEVMKPMYDWVLSIRARVLEIEDPTRYSGFFFNVIQNNHLYSVRIAPTSIYIPDWYIDNFFQVSSDNTVFRTFQLIGGSEDTWEFSIGDIKVAEGYPVPLSSIGFSPTYEIAFGDGTSRHGVNAKGEWASLQFSQHPSKFKISNNFPNPFNTSTKIEYKIPTESNVVIRVINIRGIAVDKFDLGTKEPGRHLFKWHADKFPSGVYFYQVQMNNATLTEKMLLIK